MKEITTRSLFRAIMGFEPAPRTLNWEFGYWGGALRRWYAEGLPEVKGPPTELRYGNSITGAGQPSGTPSFSGTISPRDSDVRGYFAFDDDFRLVPYNYWIYPRFEKKIISEDAEYREIWDGDGIRKKVFKDDSSMPFWLEYPVKSRGDWQRVKEERFRLDSVGTRWAADRDQFVERTRNRAFPLGVLGAPVGFFGSLRALFGEKELFMVYYDDPSLVHEIADHLCRLWLAMAEEMLSVMEFDIACFWEDMAGKQGSLISPAFFREFMTPYYRRIIGFLRSRGIELFVVDTDGKVDELIPLFLETGMNAMYPFERQAGNDPGAIGAMYPDLRMFGGIDKNVLSRSRDDIDRELQRVPSLIRRGGYIPFADHLIPPNCPWENFLYYRRRLAEIIDSTPVAGTRAARR